MTASLKNISNKIMWLLMAFLLMSFPTFGTYTWGKYIYLGCCVLMLMVHTMSNSGKLKVHIAPYHIYYLVFCLYCAVSSLWAIASADAIGKAMTIALTLVISSMVYIHYSSFDSIDTLLTAIKWAGYMVAVYCVFFYGLDGLILASQSARLQNEFANVNSIALFLARACVLFFFNWVYGKRYLIEIPFVILSVVIISATQSRKALVFVLLGCLGILVLKNLGRKNIVKSAARIILMFVLFVVVLYFVLSLPMFSGILERMTGLINSFTGEGAVDSSTRVRNNMIQLGWEWFLQYPIGGIGIGCPRILAARNLSVDTYLHNNYMELLCGGGIIGFMLYYSGHVYLLRTFIKNRASKEPYCVIGITLVVLILVMDWGMVSYYGKENMFYMMFLFLNEEQVKKGVVSK